MQPIQKSLICYRGITFNFFLVLREDISEIGTFTANPGNSRIITSVAHGLAIGDIVNFTSDSGGTLPSPIENKRDYFVISVPNSTQFTFSADYNGPIFIINTAGTPPNLVYTSRPFDLTDWSVWAWVKETPAGAVILDLDPEIDTDPTTGKISMTMTDEETILLTPGDFYWDMVLEDPSGARWGPLFAGTFSIVHLITEPSVPV